MLRDIVKNKDFDELFDPLFDCIDRGYPSSFLVGIFSLVYHPAHIKIRETSGKEVFHFHYKAKDEKSSFHDQFIDTEIKNRVNIWIEDSIDALLFEPSSLLTERLKKLLDIEEEVNIFLSHIFHFFLKKLNIEISFEKSQSYAKFIRAEIQKSLKNISLEEI